jgi:hypothetical protein
MNPSGVRPRRRHTTTLALLAVVLATGCVGQYRWVGPAGLDAHEADLADCRYESALRADHAFWFERQHLQREAWWSRRPADRAMANARLQQIEMMSAMHRQQAFEGCMAARGYVQQQVGP